MRSRVRRSGRVTRPDEESVIFGCATGVCGFAGQQMLDAMPLLVGEFVASGGYGFSSRDRADASNSSIVNTP